MVPGKVGDTDGTGTDNPDEAADNNLSTVYSVAGSIAKYVYIL